jgi:type II secretory pathway component GspD/PulD (secretin)
VGLTGATVMVPHWADAQTGRTATQQMGLVETGPGRLSIDVQGAEIRTLLRAFAEFSGRNIIVGKDVKGQISVSVRDTPWRDALASILRAHGLDLAEESGGIRVDTAEKLQAELLARETNVARRLEVKPMETRVFRVNYANARELQPVLQSVLSKRGQIQVDPRTNSLVVTDIPRRLDDAEKMADELDTKTPQIEIIAKLVDVDVSALREWGINWTWNNVKFDPNSDVSGEGTIAADLSDPLLRFKTFVMGSDGNLEVELQALEQQRKANIISNPRITTVDNREAKILVGQKIPLIVQDVAGNAVSQLTQIGIQLKVIPHITADDKIILDIHPEVSDLSTQSTVQGGIIR